MPLLPVTMFNPQAGASSYYDPVQRLRELTKLYGQYPGRAPGGSGPTGVMPSLFGRDYEDMLGEQREYANLQALVNREAMPVVQGAKLEEEILPTRVSRPATGGFNPFAFIGNKPAWQGAADISQGYTTAVEGLRKAGAPAGDPRVAEYERRVRMMR